MRLFFGLDVSLEKTAICVISEHGTEACTRVDLRRRLLNREAHHLLKGKDRTPAANPACAKPLD